MKEGRRSHSCAPGIEIFGKGGGKGDIVERVYEKDDLEKVIKDEMSHNATCIRKLLEDRAGFR